MSKYNHWEHDILIRARDNNNRVCAIDQDYADDLDRLFGFGLIKLVEVTCRDGVACDEKYWALTPQGKRTACALINLAKKNIGKPGHCTFCGNRHIWYSIHENGVEFWECPRCGDCEDWHLDAPIQLTPQETQAGIEYHSAKEKYRRAYRLHRLYHSCPPDHRRGINKGLNKLPFNIALAAMQSYRQRQVKQVFDPRSIGDDFVLVEVSR